MKKCDVCGEFCYDEKYPEIVFNGFMEDGTPIIICENCSIDYEEFTAKNGFEFIRERD